MISKGMLRQAQNITE